MEPLFEAKARYADDYILYNIFRIGTNQYKAQLVIDESGDYNPAAPIELIVSKENHRWQTEDSAFNELGITLGAEIDVFNHGYGDILGHIGVE